MCRISISHKFIWCARTMNFLINWKINSFYLSVKIVKSNTYSRNHEGIPFQMLTRAGLLLCLYWTYLCSIEFLTFCRFLLNVEPNGCLFHIKYYHLKPIICNDICRGSVLKSKICRGLSTLGVWLLNCIRGLCPLPRVLTDKGFVHVIYLFDKRENVRL